MKKVLILMMMVVFLSGIALGATTNISDATSTFGGDVRHSGNSMKNISETHSNSYCDQDGTNCETRLQLSEDRYNDTDDMVQGANSTGLLINWSGIGDTVDYNSTRDMQRAVNQTGLTYHFNVLWSNILNVPNYVLRSTIQAWISGNNTQANNRIDSVNTSLQNEETHRINNDTDIRNEVDNVRSSIPLNISDHEANYKHGNTTKEIQMAINVSGSFYNISVPCSLIKAEGSDSDFCEDDGGGVNHTDINISKLIINDMTFPTSDGTANYVLKTDGSGAVTWQPDATGGGGGDSVFYVDGSWIRVNTSKTGGVDDLEINNINITGTISNTTHTYTFYDLVKDRYEANTNTQLSDQDILDLGYNHTSDVKVWVNANDDYEADTNCSVDGSCGSVTYDTELNYIGNCSGDDDCSNILYDSEHTQPLHEGLGLLSLNNNSYIRGLFSSNNGNLTYNSATGAFDLVMTGIRDWVFSFIDTEAEFESEFFAVVTPSEDKTNSTADMVQATDPYYINYTEESELNVNDSDKLDGQDGSYYLDNTNDGNNYTTAITVTNGTVHTITLSRLGLPGLNADFQDRTVANVSGCSGCLSIGSEVTDTGGLADGDDYEANSNASTACTGTDTYLSGDGTCEIDADTQLSEATVEGYVGDGINENFNNSGYNSTQDYNCLNDACTAYTHYNGSCLIQHAPDGSEVNVGSGC